jgi:hypothetical protein
MEVLSPPGNYLKQDLYPTLLVLSLHGGADTPGTSGRIESP